MKIAYGLERYETDSRRGAEYQHCDGLLKNAVEKHAEWQILARSGWLGRIANRIISRTKSRAY